MLFYSNNSAANLTAQCDADSVLIDPTHNMILNTVSFVIKLHLSSKFTVNWKRQKTQHMILVQEEIIIALRFA